MNCFLSIPSRKNIHEKLHSWIHLFHKLDLLPISSVSSKGPLFYMTPFQRQPAKSYQFFLFKACASVLFYIPYSST